MDDSEKNKAILSGLNEGKDDGDWIAASGLHTMLAIRIEPNNSQTVVNNQGMTVKVFFNKKTGETRTYIANIVYKKP
jgi:hypothetical protein